MKTIKDYGSRKLLFAAATSLACLTAWLLTGRSHDLYSALTYSLLASLGLYLGGNVGALHVQSKANPVVNKKK